MGTYYRTYKDVIATKNQNQSNIVKMIAEKIKNPIKYDIYPTIIASNTDETIEYKLYSNRTLYTNTLTRQGEYTYTGYDADILYTSLYQKIYELNVALWEVSPIELATAYLDLYEEFQLFEQWNTFMADVACDPGTFGTKARLTARKCGIDMTSGLEVANTTGFFKALNYYTGGVGSYYRKSDFAKYVQNIEAEINKGDNAFDVTDDEYGMIATTRDILPCMYTMLNLFCGMYRDIFIYRNPKFATDETPKLNKANGFDEYRYRKNNGELFDISKILLMAGIIIVFIMFGQATNSDDAVGTLIMGTPFVVIGLMGVFSGWNS